MSYNYHGWWMDLPQYLVQQCDLEMPVLDLSVLLTTVLVTPDKLHVLIQVFLCCYRNVKC